MNFLEAIKTGKKIRRPFFHYTKYWLISDSDDLLSVEDILAEDWEVIEEPAPKKTVTVYQIRRTKTMHLSALSSGLVEVTEQSHKKYYENFEKIPGTEREIEVEE